VEINKGILYIVPTPIGNLEDMTYRSVKVLSACDIIYAEDTRTTGILCKHYQIEASFRSFHLHNEHVKKQELVAEIKAGKTVALVSDAGTPGISDPGYLAVKACIEAGLLVEVLPGAGAVIPALVESGLPCDRFVFEGFLPQKKGRLSRIKSIGVEDKTVVLFESPHRIGKLLLEIAEHISPYIPMSVSRELTKHFHETLRGDAATLIRHFDEHPPKGEFVVVLSPQLLTEK
jgi:16S rRNA (cytidine1402-2'-O)-methyltransferase